MPIEIEGMTPEEILGLPDDYLDSLVLNDESIIFRAGSAEILGKFKIDSTRLIVELAQIEGGGEGVLPTLWRLTERYAVKRSLEAIEWIVYAVHCAHPNMKLRRLLEHRGFVVEDIAEYGTAYHYIHPIHRKTQHDPEEIN